MGFFDTFPPPEPPQPPRRPRRPAWRSPGRNVKPVALAVDGILVRREELAVYVNDFNVYPSGFTLTITTLRRQRAGAGGWDGHSPRDPSPFGPRRNRGGGGAAEEVEGVLRFGVRFADGRSGVLEGLGAWRGESGLGDGEPPAAPVVSTHSGHGNESEWVQGLWVWGIPEEGDVELIYSWLAESVPESRFLLDGDVLRDAAARAVTLWDEAEESEEGDGA
jgi:hypothetical protein